MTKDEAIEVLRSAFKLIADNPFVGLAEKRLAIDALKATATIDTTPVLAAVGVEKPQPGWISVDDRLPEESKDVLVLYWPYDNHENAQLVGQAHYHDGGFYNDDGDDWHPPSHWMPLPPTPATQPAAAPAPTDAGIPISDERAAFEAWKRRECGADDESLQRRADGHYSWGRTCDMFAAWQARGQQQAGVADAVDAARFRYIEDNGSTHGGGNGFTITCFVPVDHEDMGCGIDAAIARSSVPGEA